jgi:FtsZ-interacting cell division protein ZipA
MTGLFIVIGIIAIVAVYVLVQWRISKQKKAFHNDIKKVLWNDVIK